MKRFVSVLLLLLAGAASAQNFPTIGSLGNMADAHILRFPFLFQATNAPPMVAQRMVSWWNAMNNIGAVTNLVDAGLLRRDQNGGYGLTNQAISLYGNTIQITNMNWTLDGLFCNTTNGVITQTFPAVTNPFTLLVEWKGVNATLYNPQFAAEFYLQDTNSYATASFGAYLVNPNRACVLVQFPSATTSGAMIGYYTNQIGLEPVITYPRTFVFTSDGTGLVTTYCDGLPLGPTTQMSPFSLPLGRLVLGNRLFGAATPINGTFCSYGIWTNQAMTSLQVSNLVQAWRWLDPATENVIFGGDSTTAFVWQGNDTNECWPNQISRTIWGQGKRFYNIGSVGATTVTISNLIDTATQNWKPRADGAVTKSTLFWYAGINDYITTNQASAQTNTTITTWFGFNAMAKDRGLRSIGSTFHNANFWVNTANTNYQTALNATLLARSPEMDGVIRRDLLFPTRGEPYVTYDDYHLNTNGNVITRDAVIGQYNLDSRLISITNFAATYATLSGDGNMTNALLIFPGGIIESNANGAFASKGGIINAATLWSTNGVNSTATNVVLVTAVTGFTNSVAAPGVGGTNAMLVNVQSTSGTLEIYWKSGTGGGTVCGRPIVTNTLFSGWEQLKIPVNCGFVIRSGVGIRIDAAAE